MRACRLAPCLGILLAGCTGGDAKPPSAPPASQAQVPAPRSSQGDRRPARRLDGLKGLENAAQVAPAIYRGAKPSEEGLDALKGMGVKTVVNLRHYHGSSEERECRKRGLDYVRIQLESSDAPSDEDVRRFLEIVTDPARQPVYFHCRLGKDRTGVMCAAYRMAVEDWTLQEALAEMDAFGFNKVWDDLRDYVKGFPARKDRIRPSPRR